MAQNFISCENCGITFAGKNGMKCPNCGTVVTAPAVSGDPVQTLTGGVDMRFDSDRIPLKDLLTVALVAVVMAIFCIVLAVSTQQTYREHLQDYEDAYGIVYDGEFQELMDKYHDIEDRVNNGGSYTNDELKAYREVKAILDSMPMDVYSLLARSKGTLGYLNTVTVVYVVDATLLIIMAALVLMRFRLSFRAAIVTVIAVIIAEIVTDIWGMAVYGASLNIHRYAIFGTAVILLIKECIGCDQLINVGVPSSLKPVTTENVPVGAAMPVVKELYSFEDMPELSGMKGLEDVPPPESQDADDKDDVMDAVAPIGVEQTRSEAPKYTPSEVAPEEQPVVPLTNYQIGGSITEEGENVAITPLARPMFEVDMMEDEAMPAIGGDVPEDAPAMTVSADMSSPTAERPVGIWFCSVCGNLNEHVKVCNGCGSPHE